MNQFGYGMLATPQDKDVVLPNVYVLNAGAWLDLTAGPIVPHISEVPDRYFPPEILDAWTDVAFDPGTRLGTREGDSLIAGPNCHGTSLATACGVEERVEPKWAVAALEPVASARASTPSSRRRAGGYPAPRGRARRGSAIANGLAFGASLATDDRRGEWPRKAGRRSCTQSGHTSPSWYGPGRESASSRPDPEPTDRLVGDLRNLQGFRVRSRPGAEYSG
jgi:hypothetical protein